MDFSWPYEYEQYKTKVISFVEDEISGEAVSNDRNENFPRAKWEKCAGFGIQKLALDSEFGGPLEEVNFLRSVYAMEGFGYACDDNGLAFGLNAQMWTVQTPILKFGSEAQKSKYLIPMGSGSMIGAHALTEREAGSDIFAMKTSAEKVKNGYIINGDKCLITLAPVADFVLVFAMTNSSHGKWGMSAFLIDRETVGMEISSKQSKMGMRSIPIGEIKFKDCFVPETTILGKPGLGFSILNHSLEYDRCFILASQLGAMEKQLEISIQFVKDRKQFGKSVGSFQSVSNRIADMKLRLETSRLLLYKASWLKARGQNALLESALLKLQLSESFLLSSIDGIRNQGGRAYLSDNGIERNLRDAVGGILYAGTSDIQRNIIAQLLGL